MKWFSWLGPAIFIVAFALRLMGLGWGLPNDLHNDSYHPDEPINLGNSRLIDPAHFQLTPPADLKLGEPGFYSYGTFFFTLSRVAAAYCPMPDAINDQTLPPYNRCCIYAGRILSALFGAGTAWLLFEILRRRTHVLGATAGGLAIAFAPAFVVHSRFDTVDVTATFLFACSMLFALKLLPDQEGEPPSHYIRWAVLAGLFAGLSAGTKYTGGVGILGVWAAIALARRPDWLRLSLGATLAAAIAFFASTPGALIDHDRFISGLQYEVAHVATGHGLVFVDTPPAAIEHLISLEIGLGFLVLVFGIGGLAFAAYKRYPWAIVVLAFAIPYYLIISRGEVKFLRYTFPLYPALATGFGWIAGQAHKRKDNTGRAVVGFCIIGIGLQAATANQYTFWMAGADPRDEAGQLFKQLAQNNPNISVGVPQDPWFYTPALYKDTAMPRPEWMREGLQKMSEASAPKVVYYRPYEDTTTGPPRADYVTYSSLTSFDLERLMDAKGLKPDDQTAVNQWKATLDALKRDYKEFKLFGTPDRSVYREDLEYVHPTVYVWKRKDLP